VEGTKKVIFYIDNFLPKELFESLNSRMLWRYKPNLRQDFKQHDVEAVRIRTSSDNNDYTESAVLLGKMVPDVILAIKDYMVNERNWKNPEASSIWFQYMSVTQQVGPHFDDGYIRNRKPHQCFSTFLYSHNVWEDDYGGELCVHGTEVLPKPNRLIVYSRDEQHWVKPIKHDIKEYQRMFLGISWSTDNDF
jgi:hypothetical protein